MKKSFFKIIIPCFNAENYIEKCIGSIEEQTFKDFYIVAIDDLSTDNSFQKVKELAKKYNNIICIEPKKKSWIGGARNIGIHADIESEYTLFVDNDDFMSSNNCLESIYKTIKENPDVDCVRLSYYFVQGYIKSKVELKEDNPKDLVNSVYIAPWTKCIKSNLIVDFPENTLIEDVVQHIAQIDKIEKVAVCNTPIMCWNRNNKKSCSLKENQHFYNSKRISSIYRNIADLMDLQCQHEYCEEHRKWRISCYKNIVKEGKEETF